MSTKNNACRILVGRSEGKRPLGIPRSKCEANIKMNLKAIKCNIVDWVYISLRVAKRAGCCENGNEPSGYIKYGDFFEYLKTYWFLKKDDVAWS